MPPFASGENGSITGKEETDSQLVRRFKLGDESAFACILKRYQSRLFRVARIMLGNDEDAFDISQEAFVRVYSNLKKFNERASLYTWLYRIQYNLCLSFLRRKKLVAFFSISPKEEQPERVFPTEEAGPLENYGRSEFKKAVESALLKLPPRQRMVFMMRQLDGVDYPEISKVMGISHGAVRGSYSLAIRKLKKILSPYKEGI